jgi:hypothetical protein
MRMIFLLAPALFAAAALASCSKGNQGSGSTGQTICDAGENIFCRCPGGEAGTKQCKADGLSFEECVTREGACLPIGSPTSSSSSGGGGSGAHEYLGTCKDDRDCIDTYCLYGYCTKDCAKFDDCTLGAGECVTFSDGQFCMPVCTITADCEAAYGSDSQCGYTTAVDGFPVTTCATWGASLLLPPEGSDCSDDLQCNLGNEGVQSACTTEGCLKGCFVEFDCPVNTSCSSDGEFLGSCE